MAENKEITYHSGKGLVISIRKARKVYYSWREHTVVFNNLNMSVKKGCLYALLGASGCGKTTLLKCVIGSEMIDSGDILVFGGIPGSKESGVPGPRIGYLPQMEGLFNQFSIIETLLYFGWIAGMKKKNIIKKADELMTLLQLPNRNNEIVGNLSGGEKRRVSLAASLLHEPELVVLDEPTVGLDPMLREIIWEYLRNELKKGKTIIVTTHYIEEANQATIIGLMRRGEILAEESPNDLLRNFHCDYLESAFLQLSKIQEDNYQENYLDQQVIFNEISLPLRRIQEMFSVEYSSNFKFRNISTLVWKNSLWFRRSWVTINMILYVVFLSILFNTTIGLEPKSLKLGVLNGEYPDLIPCPFNNTCVPEGLSCRFLEHLGRSGQVLVPFKDRKSGEKAVLDGNAWSLIQIPSNFSETFFDGIKYGRFSNNIILDLDSGRIDVTMDMSDYTNGYFLQASFIKAFNEFSADLARSCGYLPEAFKPVPIKFEKPIYGVLEPSYIDFLMPGLMLLLVFFFMVSSCTATIIIEKNEGIWERSFVIGVTRFEIIISHVIIQHILSLAAIAIIISISTFVFNVKNNGNISIMFLFLLLTGSVGIFYGTLISCTINVLWLAVFLTIGTFTPTLAISDILWPIQGQFFLLRYFSRLMPITIAAQSLRSVMIRGWGLEEPSIYFGLVYTSLWIVAMATATMFAIKLKTK